MNKIKIIINTLLKIFLLKKQNIRISILAFFDKKCEFISNNFIDRFVVLHNVKIGEYSYIGYNSKINNCKIGKFCSISADVKIGLGKHPIDRISTSPIIYSNSNPFNIKIASDKNKFKENEEVIIGNDVWIGTNAIIMGGVTIGDGAIIAAGAVVVKDVGAYEIVGGVPAKLIRKRFSDMDINNLLLSKWWEWDITKIKKNIDYLNNKKEFIDLLNWEHNNENRYTSNK